MIDPRLLRTFLAICREASISGAARRLNLSQPSVSIAMKQLEQAVRAPLLDRSGRGVSLTDAGRALMRRAEMMEALLFDAEEAVALAGLGTGGPLNIGGTPGALVSLVPAAIARMEQGRRMKISILEGTDAQLVDLLRRGTIEVAVVTTGIQPPPDDLEERSIARDPFSLIVGRAHAALGDRVSLADVSKLGWVLPQAKGAFHRQTEALFLAAEIAVPGDVIRCDSLLTSKAIVRNGRRVTVLPRGVVAAELSMGVLRALPIADVAIARTVGIQVLRGRMLSDLAVRFVADVQRHSSTL
jgi:LysR family hydrogen peroxide-inducible transcriptional activator